MLLMKQYVLSVEENPPQTSFTFFQVAGKYVTSFKTKLTRQILCLTISVYAY